MFYNRTAVLPSKAVETVDGVSVNGYKLSLHSDRVYVFLTEPNSSVWAFRYSVLLSLCVVLNAIFLVLETVDGPNHYTGRKNMATYKDLPNSNVSTEQLSAVEY